MKNLTYLIFSLFLTTVIAGKASAGIIVGGSDLLNNSQVNQLENWLGEGPLALTNIYSKKQGDRAADWHGLVDNMGRTFTLFEVALGNRTMLMGGYNPFSWDASLRSYRVTPDPADRTAFIFNLTLGMKLDQVTDPSSTHGTFQTYNNTHQGPIWGVGWDLMITSDLSHLRANLGYSYGDTSRRGDNDYAASFAGSHERVDLVRMETFTIAPHTPSDVSAPGSLALMGIGLLTLAIRRRVK